MSKYASKKFWSDTADRVIATTAQSAVAALSANAAGILDIDFAEVASIAGLAGLVALLTSIAFRGREEVRVETVTLPTVPTSELFEPETLIESMRDAYADNGEGESVDLDGDGDALDGSIELGPDGEPRGRYAADG